MLGSINFNEFLWSYRVQKMTEIAKEKGYGWVEYKWPKPGSEMPTPERTYFMRVPGQDFLIACGYYLE